MFYTFFIRKHLTLDFLFYSHFFGHSFFCQYFMFALNQTFHYIFAFNLRQKLFAIFLFLFRSFVMFCLKTWFSLCCCSKKAETQLYILYIHYTSLWQLMCGQLRK